MLLSVNPGSNQSKPPATPEPAWEVALLYPPQGSWSEEEYLELKGNRLIEYSNGHIEVLATPTDSHQAIVAFLYSVLAAFASRHTGGTVRFAPLRLRLWPGKFREPDLLFLRNERGQLRGEAFWSGADLVVEVVSDDDRRRDLEVKRREYALAGIDEYWIVDPQRQLITVLRRDGERYVVHGEFGRGMRASSKLLPGLDVDVNGTFDAK